VCPVATMFHPDLTGPAASAPARNRSHPGVPLEIVRRERFTRANSRVKATISLENGVPMWQRVR